MFSIGEFSLLARVSRRLLSHCEILGLLRPAMLDELSGERYYSAAQLPRLNRIVVLKELGFDLQNMVRLVDHVQPAELRGMVLWRRCEASRLSSADAEAGLMARLARVETRIAQIEDHLLPSAGDVSLRAEPTRRFLCLRETLPSFAKIRAVLGTIADSVRRAIPTEMFGPLTAVSHSREFELEHMDMQLGVVLRHSTPYELRLSDRRTLTTQDLPEVARMAICVHTGLPEHAHLITARLARFVEANGYRLAGPSRKVFIDTGEHAALQQPVVEMQFPIIDREPASRAALHRVALDAEG